jgi:hypothetical protein
MGPDCKGSGARTPTRAPRSARPGPNGGVVDLATFAAARFPRLGCALRRRPFCDGGGSQRARRSAILAGARDRASSPDSRSPVGRRPLPGLGVRRAALHGSRAGRRALRAVVHDRAADAWRRQTATRCRHRVARRTFRFAGHAEYDCGGCTKRFGLRALCRKKSGGGGRDACARADGVDGTPPGCGLRRPAISAGRLRGETAPGGPANDRNCNP